MGRSGGVQSAAPSLPSDLPTGGLGETLLRATISSITLAALTSAQLLMVGIELFAGQVITNLSFVSGSTAVNTPVNQWFGLFSPARARLGVTVDDTATAWGTNAVKTLALGVFVADAVTNTDTSLTSATAAFVAGDVGTAITGAGIAAGTTISSVTNATTVVLSQATTATATGVKISWARATTYTVPTTGLYYLGCLVKATIAVPTLQGILVPNTTVLNLPPIICGNADASLVGPATCPTTASAITVAGTVPYAYVT